ncbi:hypothetical protein OIV83_003994 [Microbotryomycetes sp. JL201]|nr:hypothetical protein OIV83_003994 [Microbotryomycetes sp. JL201]
MTKFESRSTLTCSNAACSTSSGQDPRLEFRKPGKGASLLLGPAISASDSYWRQYWTLFESASDVVTLLDSFTLTKAAQQSPTNLHTLITVLSNHLASLLTLPQFPHSTTTESNTRARNSTAQANDRQLAKEALNCIRVLTRVVPYVLKPQSAYTDQLEEAIFWTSDKTRCERQSQSLETFQKPNEHSEEEAGQFVIDDEDEAEARTEAADHGTQRENVNDEHHWQTIPPLAERLLSTLVELLFVPGFTLSEEYRTTEDSCLSYVIWEPGIAHSPATLLPATPQHILYARLEVLRLFSLLLALPSLLTPPHLFPTLPNRWRDLLVSSTPGSGSAASSTRILDRNVVLCLLCSLINTSLGSSTLLAPSAPRDEGPRGIAASSFSLASGAAEKLGGVVLRKEDIRGLLVTTCLQVLGQLLAEHAPSGTDPTTQQSESRRSSLDQHPLATPQIKRSPSYLDSSKPIAQSNAFAYFISKLHRASDFDLIIRGVLSVIERTMSAKTETILPGVSLPSLPTSNSSLGHGGPNSQGPAGLLKEALAMLWRTIELNRKFVAYLVETDKAGELLAWLVMICLEFKDDEVQSGLVRMAAFMMQTISTEKGLSHRLTAPIDLKPSLRARYGVPGTLADFLIVSIYTLIFTTKARLSSLYPSFILTIDNCSPCFKNLSQVSATRLVQLFLALSSPDFLLMEEGNPRLVYYLLETFNNNPELIYALLRSHKRFELLSTFTLAGGIREAKRLKDGRRQDKAKVKPRRDSTTQSRRASRDDGEKGDEASEKVKGKRPERQADESSRRNSLAALSVRDLTLSSNDEVQNPVSAGSEARGSDQQVASEDAETVFFGKNGFMPTEGWVTSWRTGLPLDSIMIMLSELRPLVLDLVNNLSESSPPLLSTSSPSPSSAISLLSSASLSGLLPPAPQPVVRKFTFSRQSITWFASIIYGSIYLSMLELCRDVPVQLFGVATASRASGVLGRQVGNPLEFVSEATRGLFGGSR